MAYSKQIGPVLISESAGVATVSVSVSETAGGGSVAGFVTASLSAQAQVSAIELVNAGLALAAEKFPAAASLITGVQAIVDAEVAKI